MSENNNEKGTNENPFVFKREELIQQIKDCGEAIIKNAETILGDEKYFLNLRIAFTINKDKEEDIPKITIQRNFIPEQQIERIIKNTANLNKENEKKEETKDESND